MYVCKFVSLYVKYVSYVGVYVCMHVLVYACTYVYVWCAQTYACTYQVHKICVGLVPAHEVAYGGGPWGPYGPWRAPVCGGLRGFGNGA